MANIMSSMKIPIQKLVSKKKKRYTEDGFNLDLAYILPNLIAMGFPANKIEGVYRNHIDEVYRFLEMKHDGVYKIYNLCSERRYDSNKFHSRVARYPFHDHNPPNIEQIQAFCDDVHQWLNANPKHIAAVHCKAGKGRTGTMICCYMLHNRRFVCANEALLHYGEQRTHDQKGVTIPSQRRYVEYYSHLLKSGQPYARVPLQICEMRLSSPPLLNNHPGSIYFSISYVSDTNEYPLYTSEVPKASNSTGNLVIGLDRCIALAGDIKVEFFNKRLARKNSVLFRFWFNTYFVNELHKDKNESCNQYLEYVLTKNEIDYAHKDTHNKMYPPDFKVLVTLQRTPAGSYVQGPEQDIHQLQYQAAAVAAAAAAAAAAASTDHHHKHHPLQPHNHHAQHPAQPFSNLHHNHHYSNSNHHQPVAQPPLHPHLPVTIQTTTTTSSPPSMVAAIGGPVGSPQPQQENHMYHHHNLHHMHTHPNHLSHHHLHHHSHRHAQAPLLQQTNSCDLSLGEGGTDEECSHHPTPSDSPEASSSGGSSTGEDWESGEFNINSTYEQPHLCTEQLYDDRNDMVTQFGGDPIIVFRRKSPSSPTAPSTKPAAPLRKVKKVKTKSRSSGNGGQANASSVGGSFGGHHHGNGGGGVLPASRTPSAQFKAKSSNIRIDGAHSAGGSGGSAGLSASARKVRWLTNMRSDPDFRDAFARNVNVIRAPRQLDRLTPDDDSMDDLDYYSAMCDNQLSVGASPCKSPLEMMALLAGSRGVRQHRLGSVDSGGGGGGMVGYGSEPGGRRNSGAGLNGSSFSNHKHSWSSNVGSRRSAALNGDVKGLPSDCKVLVVAKPIESQLIGFKVDSSNGFNGPTRPSAHSPPPISLSASRVPSPTDPSPINGKERLCTTAVPLDDDPVSLASGPKTVEPSPLNADATDLTGKQPMIESSFKQRFLGISNAVTSQAKTKSSGLPWFWTPKTSTTGTKRSSFSFREIRQELQAVMRQNSRSSSSGGGNGTTAQTSSTTATKALAIQPNASTPIALEVVREDTA